MNSLEAMKMALEEMEYARANRVPNMGAAIEALRQAIEQAEKREWVGLTDEDLEPMCDDWRIVFGPYVHDFARSIEAKLKEKNT